MNSMSMRNLVFSCFAFFYAVSVCCVSFSRFSGFSLLFAGVSISVGFAGFCHTIDMSVFLILVWIL